MTNQRKILNSGPFKVRYDNGFLRYIRYGEDEILRMIYFVLRDENWGTHKNFIENEQLQIQDNGFSIEYDCYQRKGDANVFYWKASIKASADGEISFNIHGKALDDVLKNRAGFCILHPIKECVGREVSIFHDDGTTTQSVFPVNVAPDDPFKEIRSMRWEVADQEYELIFEGDIFQTEDQRNWTDASYKTFCTPLRIPFPVLLKKGDLIHQKVIFKPVGKVALRKSERTTIQLNVSEKLIPFPAIGLADSKGDFSESVFPAIRSLNLDHLRIDVDLADREWKKKFFSASDHSLKFDLPLNVVLHLPEDFNEVLETFLLVIGENKIRLISMLLLSNSALTTPQDVIDYIVQVKGQLPDVLVGAGTDYNFTELNRNRFIPGELDFVSYSVYPQAHAVDDLTIIENLEGQRHTAITAHAIYPDQQAHVSAITLKARFNPNATNDKERVKSVESQLDSRQKNELGAVWTLGSIKQLAEGGASAITYFQVCGEMGIVSAEGAPYPVYQALQKILSLRTDKIRSSASSHPLIVDGLFFENRQGLAWNYTSVPQHIELFNKEFEIEPYGIKTVTF